MKKLFLLLSVIFLSRIVNSQNWYWARASSGSSVQLATGVAVDGSGNVYVTGFFDGGSITFGTTTVTSAGNRDIFLVKYSPCGNVLWAKSFGGASYDASWSVATDASGNVFVTGYIEGTANFGSVTLTPGGTNPNVFLVKCNPAGVVQWAKNSSGSAPIPPGTLVDNQGHCVSTDAAGNSYITGWFATTNITFAPTTLVNASSSGVPYEVFVVKYDAAGNMVWAKSAQGTQNDFGNSIAADNFGNVYVTGSHMTTINFGNTSLVNSTFNSDMFLVKYDASTGSDLWSTKGIPNNASGPTEIGQTVATDAPGNIYVGGQYSSPYIIFGTDTLFNSQTSFPMTYDYFIAKYNSAGAAQWAKSGGSASGN
ncbi:MAG: SBBP repeat-containing protein [Bacteroidetes bacterium]|nr:SBBP repeat-containing protein [Bacteroidota bacterium]